MSSSNKAKGTRFHSQWRVDADYKDKLSSEELAWYEQFEDEYYRGSFGENRFHRGALRLQTMAGIRAAVRDIVTQTDEAVQTAAASKPNVTLYNLFTVYSAEDYLGCLRDSEESLAEALDLAARNQSN